MVNVNQQNLSECQIAYLDASLDEVLFREVMAFTVIKHANERQQNPTQPNPYQLQYLQHLQYAAVLL